jgi:cytidylate kinase
MTTRSLKAIDALMRCVATQEQHREARTRPPPTVITVSSSAGAGGDEVAHKLAARLQLELFNKDIINAVAEESHVHRRVLERLDERVDGMKGAWLRSLVTGENMFKETFRRNLINVILGIACNGGVILGRGANFILAYRPVLRIRVLGSPRVCVERVSSARGVALETAETLVSDTDRSRLEFIRTMYHRDINDPLAYDLMMNSDRLESDAIVELALSALKRIKQEAPQPLEP